MEAIDRQLRNSSFSPLKCDIMSELRSWAPAPLRLFNQYFIVMKLWRWKQANPLPKPVPVLYLRNGTRTLIELKPSGQGMKHRERPYTVFSNYLGPALLPLHQT